MALVNPEEKVEAPEEGSDELATLQTANSALEGEVKDLRAENEDLQTANSALEGEVKDLRAKHVESLAALAKKAPKAEKAGSFYAKRCLMTCPDTGIIFRPSAGRASEATPRKGGWIEAQLKAGVLIRAS